MREHVMLAKLTRAIIGFLILLGVSNVQAAVVIYSGDTATGIQNLNVGGNFYNVEFVYQSANSVYGTPPTFDFDNEFEADAAVEAVRAALNGVPAVTGVSPSSHRSFLIGYSERTIFSIRFTNARQGIYIDGSWINSGFDTDEADDLKSYAVFTVTGSSASMSWLPAINLLLLGE